MIVFFSYFFYFLIFGILLFGIFLLLVKSARIWLLKRPLLSTLSSAFLLATLWAIVWFFVLLILTYATQSKTAAPVLVGGLLLSTVAEALIRVFETSSLANKYSSGKQSEEKSDMTIWKAFAFLFGGIIIVLLFGDSIKFPSDFELASKEAGGLFKMFPEWISQFSGSPVMGISLAMCLMLRTFIYKKPHKSKQWDETKKWAESQN